MIKFRKRTGNDDVGLDTEFIAKAWVRVILFKIAVGKPGQLAQFAKPIVDEIAKRQFTFLKNDLDGYLADLVGNTSMTYKFYANPSSARAKNIEIKVTPEYAAKYIAYWCQNHPNIVWDDRALSKTERDLIMQTVLGKALAEAECFLTQRNYDGTRKSDVDPRTRSYDDEKSTAKAADTAAAPAPEVPKAPEAPKAPETPAQNTAASNAAAPAGKVGSYKSTGAHSGDIPNLIGQPGQPESINGTVFCIEADMSGANIPNAFITPIKWDNVKKQVIKVSKSAAEKVKFSSGNGWTDCKLFFKTQVDAANFLVKLTSTYAEGLAKYSNIHVAKSNGANIKMYQVSTEFGINAYIRTTRLNEDLMNEAEDSLVEEVAVECAETQPAAAHKDLIENIDDYDYGMFVSIS